MPAAVLTIHLDDAELAVLDRHIRDTHPGRTREQALSEIIAQWVAAQKRQQAEGDEDGLELDELNASNDG